MDTVQPSSNGDQISEFERVAASDIVDPKEETQKVKSTEQPAAFESAEDYISELLKKNKTNEDIVNRYRQLLEAVQLGDWTKVDDFLRENPSALTSIVTEFSNTFFHLIAKSNQDGAIRLLQKFLPAVPLESLEQKNCFGHTALFSAVQLGNIKAVKLLVQFNKKLLKIKDDNDRLPLQEAAVYGHKETLKYFLSETPVEDSNEDLNPLAGHSGAWLVKALVDYNLYDIASDLLKRHPKLAREKGLHRSIILETLAMKPMGFASGSRLGHLQHLIYNCILVHVKRTQDCPQTQKNDFSLPQTVDGDTENPIQISQNSSTKSSPFRFLCATYGAWNKKLHIMLWNVLMHLAPSIRGIHDEKLMHMQTVEIVRMMCGGINWSFEEALESLKFPLLTAARLGIHEIVKEILRACHNSLLFTDKDGNNALMLAILHRQENVFKLLSQFDMMKQIKGNTMMNKHGDNLLHLAASLAPASQVPGAALQMQRELQWFKAVENYVRPTLREERNLDNETPREMFTKQHGVLVEKGERWMKDTASSCTVVISLIITVVFAAAFTVPGGNNTEGKPMFLHELPFLIFATSDALALFSSTTSLLMFLGILTSTYSEEDFLVSLPRKLIVGLITMFFSIACMTVAFGATIYIVLSQPWKWVIFPIALLGCYPVTLFAWLQFPLLVRIYSYTYAPTISKTMDNVNGYD